MSLRLMKVRYVLQIDLFILRTAPHHPLVYISANLEMFLRTHGKPTPQFIREIADKTLLVGMSSTVFRDAKYTSHEVTVDKEQLEWFEEVVKTHPSSEGWRIFVFTHAPPNGSGLRVLQENHVVNGT